MISTLAVVFGALAALLHVYIFWMESFAWRRPAVWKRFGLSDQAAADATRSMAYNQGFYNLFLAIGAAVGLVLFAASPSGSGLWGAGAAIALFALASMLCAALVLLTTGKGYLKAAATQGTLPLLGVILLIWSLAAA